MPAPRHVAAPADSGPLAALAAGATGLVCLGAYAALAAPSPYWLDSSEFAAAGFELGVAHPPGHPLAALLGKLFALVPGGSVALRVGLSQAVCGALAAALVVLVGAGLARRIGAALGRTDPLVEAALGATAGLGFGLSHAAVLQAVRPEVYALHAALSLLAVAALLRWRWADGEDPRWLLAASLALGLGVANHHFLTGLLGLAALLFVATQHGRFNGAGRARVLAACVGAGLLGLLVYAYLPLRALRHPEVDWGAPSTPARFLWTVSARAFQRSLGRAELGGAGAVALALGRELSAFAPLALLGAWVGARVAAVRPVALLLLGAAALDAAGPALVGFDPGNPDAYGYLEVAVALLAVVAVGAPAALAAMVRSRALGRGVALGLAALALALGAARLPGRSLARFADTARVGEALLDEAPPRALLVTSYYQTVFPVWYLRGVEGQRPDLDHVHRHFLAWPGYRDEVALVRPELAPLLGPRDVESGALLALAARRSVRVEYDLDLDPALLPRLVPGALLEGLVAPDAPGQPDPDAALQQVAAARQRLTSQLDLDEPETRRFVFWRAFLEAHRDCSRGRPAEAGAAIARARALLGGQRDPDLEELARRCPG